MLLVNTDFLSGKQLQTLGLVSGSAVVARTVDKNIRSDFKKIFGNEVKGYSELLDDARGLATKHLEEDARRLGADAVINVRYSIGSLMDCTITVLASGTAVRYQ
ncbi:MAG: YbjQ family protein [Erysipelotrichaceae bacterium]|nr:YbjQ family protein [Erysipelotrichaceae bacterium]